MSAPSQKPIDRYEYNVKVHEVDPDSKTVTLLFEEVDGNDGFAVAVSQKEFEEMMKNPKRFEEWARERVRERIKLLKSVREREERLGKARESVKHVEEALKKFRIGGGK